MSNKNVLIINGPNLNMLGKREKHIYGNSTLASIESDAKKTFAQYNQDWFQSTSEAEIIQKIHSVADGKTFAIIINPAAYTHTSIAIYDALLIAKEFVSVVIEVHLSNTATREIFRSNKITTKASNHVIEGFKEQTYKLALQSLQYLPTQREN